MDKDCSTFEKGYSKQENNHINKNELTKQFSNT